MTGTQTAVASGGAAQAADCSEAVELFRWAAASAFTRLFSVGLFDQAALPSVSAALQATGRVIESPWQRAARTGASEQLIFWGDETDRRAESERLADRHRAVRGIGDGGVRYSALTPESWNLILMSTFLMQRNAAAAITGHRFTPAEDQAIWQYMRELTESLQLPGGSRLPETYSAMRARYEDLVSDKLQATATFNAVVDLARRPPRPDSLPGVTAPAWFVVAPVLGHIAWVLGFGIMHPGVRNLSRRKWKPRHELEFAVLTKVLQVANRTVPKRLTYSPLAYNRWRYERLTAHYRDMGLASFRPDSTCRRASP